MKQRAMAVAKLYPDAEKRGRGNKSSLNDAFQGTYIKMARTVLKWLPEIAERKAIEIRIRAERKAGQLNKLAG
jgi:hypothetical protein